MFLPVFSQCSRSRTAILAHSACLRLFDVSALNRTPLGFSCPMLQQLPWKQVTALTLSCLHLSELFEFLSRCVHISQLTVQDLMCWRSFSNARLITLSSLTDIRIELLDYSNDDFASFRDFFSNLTTPTLKHLTISYEKYDDTPGPRPNLTPLPSSFGDPRTTIHLRLPLSVSTNSPSRTPIVYPFYVFYLV
ncbi:hypothetical protein K435DRAFT_248246 [Dendrothele bispora CBS 962.96]|uniref:F-box domain-containing protein n=1 Tax=Dendrothele bispora (strain CBS 962.96) TaxID=1314807 RepID=A0A4S8MMK6_DENBC|nr:hypothetical protein K435DRAFT_248246 [Dendrothele bispora CBS 962.96]